MNKSKSESKGRSREAGYKIPGKLKDIDIAKTVFDQPFGGC